MLKKKDFEFPAYKEHPTYGMQTPYRGSQNLLRQPVYLRMEDAFVMRERWIFQFRYKVKDRPSKFNVEGYNCMFLKIKRNRLVYVKECHVI